MDLLTIIRVVAVVSAGLLAGIYLGGRAGAHYALQKISASSFVQFQQVVHVHFVKFMPPLVLTALVSVFGWLLMVWQQRTSAEFWLIAASACGVACNAVLTRAVNVPLNNQLMTWNIEAPPANLRAIWVPWDRVNTIRTVVAAGVLILEALALNLRSAG
jgi:uncharacterized membrane protein